MTTTSGRSCSTCSQAVRPSPASPTHLHAGLGVDQGLQPLADDRVVVGQEDAQLRHGCHLPSASRGQRDAGEDRRALPGRRFDRQRPADQRQALPASPAGPAGPRAGGVHARLRVEAAAVVLDDGEHLVRGALQDQAHPPGPGVLEHVRQPLLHDPVQGRLDRRRQALRVQAGAVEVHLDPDRSDHSST